MHTAKHQLPFSLIHNSIFLYKSIQNLSSSCSSTITISLSRIMVMERSQSTCLLLVAALLSHNFVFPVLSSSFQDEKNFYFPPFPSIGFPPAPVALTPPIIDPGSPPVSLTPPIIDPGSPPVSLTPPIIDPGSPPVSLTPPIIDPGSPPVSLTPPIVDPSPPIGYSYSPPPTHGSGGSSPPAHGSGGSSPPVHHTPPHGGGSHHHGHGGTPPVNCGNPTPRSPPRHHHNPSPSHHDPSPAPPTGYHYNPPPSSGGGGGGSTPATPSTPPIVLPPTTPGIPFPSPPYDPNSPPIGGTCDFWRNHPGIIWGLFGWWGTTIGSAFGATTLPAIGAGTGLGTGTGTGTGAHLNLLEALSNTRTDGIGALYREGTASLLNSMVNKKFPFTTSHVKESFVAAVGSNKAAAAQARVFKLANEGHMKLRV